MDFSYSDEQRQLADSLRRFAEERYPIETRRGTVRERNAFSRDAWCAYAEFGLLGLTISSDYGGFDGGALDTFVVQYEAGRALLPEPLISCGVVATGLIQRYGSEPQRHDFLRAIADGSEIVTLAYQEADTRYDFTRPLTAVRRVEGGFVLDGRKTHVWHADNAQTLIVSGWNGAAQAVSLFLVPLSSPGVSVWPYPVLDGERCAEVELRSVRVSHGALLGGASHGIEMLETALDLGIAALCASSAGAMERLIEMTAEYLRTRKQFGQPLGRFQALRHRMADMLVQKELALSMAHVAAAALDVPDAAQRRRMIASAKIIVSKAARFIGQQAVQLHGGMGVTAELPVGDYLKYLIASTLRFGDADFHTEILADLPDEAHAG
ncbi:acyl-CoA dehydrogenase family protein [Caballeronia ptereochthonis]|uniref:Acyl-CoA dehydrogenase n=1 Tax=Caballeronia ptereochthonis TaxID=1777144 RepID=A0A157ZE98_9BURK|nr:acyl-CoA dehydrogenase [Caballeronia ptereochthonis]SAK43851.1 Acyl-CoA dehydrogenase [Caballeronia ptereochthonis]